MFTVALTGNVASGKSTVAAWFAEWGATVIDADQLVREVQQPGSPVLCAIVVRFGNTVLLPSGELDRAALRQIVLADPTARGALNAMVHPAVRARRDALMAQAAARGDRIVVHDIPLLFEAADPSVFDFVVLVDAPAQVRRQRLIQHRGLPADQADALLQTQLPSEPKRDRSDIVLDNTGSLADLRRDAEAAWRRIRTQVDRLGA